MSSMKRKKIEPFEKDVPLDGASYHVIFRPVPKRKTATLRFREDGVFEIRYAQRCPKAWLQSVLEEGMRSFLKRPPAPLPKPYDEKGYWLLGEYVEDPSFALLSENERIDIYKKALASHLERSFPFWVKRFSRPPGLTYTIKPLKSVYGIYDVKTRKITFTAYLAPYSPFAIDSVVAHELTHEEVHGHGPAFHSLLESVFPLYNEARKELNRHDYRGTHSKPGE